MLEIARFDGESDCLELDFGKREATSEPVVKLGIQLHLAEQSPSNIISILDMLGVQCCPSTVHNWVQKDVLQVVVTKIRITSLFTKP